MDSPPDKSADFRRQAAACVDIAQRMSLREDRARILEMAQRWLELAQKAESAEEAEAIAQRQQHGNQLPPPQPEHGQQPSLQQQQVQPTGNGDQDA
jgi:hypothetical protein